MRAIKYSVVVPVFNSESSLYELYTRSQKVFEEMGSMFEIIFVDDGSRDKSWDILSQIRKNNKDKVVAIKLSKNFGQHNALFCGFRFCRGEFVITIDDDLQIPPEDIVCLIHKQEESGADIVYGLTPEKKQPLFKRMGSRFIKLLSPYTSGGPGEGSSFRLISGDMTKKIRRHEHDFIHIDEILYWHTGNIAFTNVRHLARQKGVSGYTFFKLVKLAFNLLINYSTFPLRIMIWLGFLTALFCFFIGIIYIIRKLTWNVPIGYTSIIVSIFFSAGVILCCIGIIGEYINRIYTANNKKPQYSIEKILR